MFLTFQFARTPLITACGYIFLCIFNTLVILISILNALKHLITLLLYSGHQFMYCTVLLCIQYIVELSCLFSSWFAKEANVNNNKQQLANLMTQVQLGWGPRSLDHTISLFYFLNLIPAF